MPYTDPIYSSLVLTIASDANYSAEGDAYDGKPLKVAPTAGALLQNARPRRQRAAQHENWLMNQFAQLLQALHDDGDRVEGDFIDYQAAITALLAARRAEWLRSYGLVRALNFPTRVASGSANQRSAVFAPGTMRWYIAMSDTIQASRDGGQTWALDTPAAIAPGSSASDPSGNVVFCGTGGGGQYAYELDAVTDTWTQRTVLAGHAADGHVVFDPVSGHWVWQSYNAAVGNFLAKRSTDRVTWTDATTLPAGAAGWGATANVSDLGINPTSGRAVAIARTGATTLKVATTDDGGDTWTAQASITTTIDATSIAISFNEGEGAFYLAVGEEATPSSEVWRSVDGATWTKQCTLDVSCMHKIAGFGPLLVATATSGPGARNVYSLDSGVTWQLGGMNLEGAGKGVFAGGGRPFALTDTHRYVGVAAGEPDLGDVT